MTHREIKAMQTFYGVTKQDLAEALGLSLSAVEKKLNGSGWWLDEAIIIKELFISKGHDKDSKIEDIFGFTEPKMMVG